MKLTRYHPPIRRLQEEFATRIARRRYTRAKSPRTPKLQLADNSEPWLANPQTGVLSPIHRTLAILPVEWGLTAEVALHLAVLSLGVGALAGTWRR